MEKLAYLTPVDTEFHEIRQSDFITINAIMCEFLRCWRHVLASLTIRNLEAETKERLRIRAALNGRCMEEEARAILRATVAGATAADLWTRSRALFASAQGLDLALPERTADRKPPTFESDT